jgi:CheY-like chemotaxis protein
MVTLTIEGSCTEPLLVFLIDDDPAVASALAIVLGTGGCEVKTFLSGRDLIDYQADAPPDVVVTDFMMQPLDGLRVAAWVRNTYPGSRRYDFGERTGCPASRSTTSAVSSAGETAQFNRSDCGSTGHRFQTSWRTRRFLRRLNLDRGASQRTARP